MAEPHPVTTQPSGKSSAAASVPAPRIYNFFPRLAGPISEWHRHLDRIEAMHFDWIFVNPVQQPGLSGSLYAIRDPFAFDSVIAGEHPEAAFQSFVEAAHKRGLRVMMDLVINHTSIDADIIGAHPDWFAREADGSLQHPGAAVAENPGERVVWGDLAAIDYADPAKAQAICGHWLAVIRHWLGFRIDGFRCDAAYHVPTPVWQILIGATKAERADVVFAAETLGCTPDEVNALAPAGFDLLFNSVKWWDGQADWAPVQSTLYQTIAPTIGFPESHDTERLASDLAGMGLESPAEIAAAATMRYALAAFFSAGIMAPIGFEFGFRRKLDVVMTRPEHWEEQRHDIRAQITLINRLKATTPILNAEANQRWLPAGDLIVFYRQDQATGARSLFIANPTRQRRDPVDLPGLLRAAGIEPDGLFDVTGSGFSRVVQRVTYLDPWEWRLLVQPPRWQGVVPPLPKAGQAASLQAPDWVAGDRVQIEGVSPELDGGRFPVKRVVGNSLLVECDIYADGHDIVAADVLVRPEDEAAWRAVPMRFHDNDRWSASIPLDRNARWFFTIEAWMDAFGSWRREVSKKFDAGQPITLELTEGRKLVAEAMEMAADDAKQLFADALARHDACERSPDRLDVLLAAALEAPMRAWGPRHNVTRYRRILPVQVDRPRAAFAAWYEMFPRSQGTDPNSGSTFDDCIGRLDYVQRMGFDVVYFVPIHPIGVSHRKGKNNSLTAQPGEPGSPYAIGSTEGGHDAVHPELGTLEDFRRFVAACTARNLDVALDFAIQCSPDHPWVKQHPEWFQFRPDGTIKYAENPPKKYQDIVNVDFFSGGQDALWQEIRRVVLFWCEQGVNTFRVDNPHTKPFPFWEWLIREVQSVYPQTVFLSEAFTRPKPMKRLAKCGFTQSYSYFTWRNEKQELIDYLTELTRSECAEYMRPNFFANTPDILPKFLQTGGRAGFRIRLALAATLAGVYGIYNGFELCEADAMPNSEEYRNSEKYQFKVWDWDRPGNIVDEIGRVNAIRKQNPALHEFTNLRFHTSDSDKVIFYGKVSPDRRNAVFVAVNLDPFNVHEASLQFPLWDLGIDEHVPFSADELISGQRHQWQGPWQRLRFDPDQQPAMIFSLPIRSNP